jgi:hypothetical protein
LILNNSLFNFLYLLIFKEINKEITNNYLPIFFNVTFINCSFNEGPLLA